jgi:hypothetical protein
MADCLLENVSFPAISLPPLGLADLIRSVGGVLERDERAKKEKPESPKQSPICFSLSWFLYGRIIASARADIYP